MPRDESADLMQFVWLVPQRGYVWDELATPYYPQDRREFPPFLRPHPKPSEYNRTIPLDDDLPSQDEEPLFRQFANLRPMQEDIRAFAGKYGWLGINTRVTSKQRPGEVQFGESLWRWQEEIADMKGATDVWQWIDAEDEKQLRQRIRWESADSIVMVLAQKSTRILREHYRSLFEKLRYENPIDAAKAFVLTKVNEKLLGSVSPCLLMNRRSALVGRFRPDNLLAALWVLFFQTIHGQIQIVSCQYCGKWIDITGHRRSKKAHARCVHNAKMARYRKKRASQASAKKRQSPMTPRGKGSVGRTR